MKARKLTSDDQILSDKKSKWNLNINLPSVNTQSSIKINNFNDARVNWINKINK